MKFDVLGLISNPALVTPIIVGILTWLAANKKTTTEFTSSMVNKWEGLYGLLEKQRDEYKQRVRELEEEIAGCPAKKYHREHD